MELRPSKSHQDNQYVTTTSTYFLPVVQTQSSHLELVVDADDSLFYPVVSSSHALSSRLSIHFLCDFAAAQERVEDSIML